MLVRHPKASKTIVGAEGTGSAGLAHTPPPAWVVLGADLACAAAVLATASSQLPCAHFLAKAHACSSVGAMKCLVQYQPHE